ncbi:MAG: hypothetical protein ACRYGP_28380 [Janthinobacterium lividum]
MPEISPVRTTITLAPGETVELIREPCDCPEGQVCAPESLFAQACPRRSHDDAALALLNRRDDR